MPFEYNPGDEPYRVPGSHPASPVPPRRGRRRVLRRPAQTWDELIQADPWYLGELGALGAEEVGDVSDVKGALRTALIRMGGGGLSQAAAALGGGEWADLLDPTTLAAAQAADVGGTSTSAQLQKAHEQKQLAEADVRAARGITSSGQTGYELGQEQQRHAISVDQALQALTDFLKGNVGALQSRRHARRGRRSGLGGAALQRLAAMGVAPAGEEWAEEEYDLPPEPYVNPYFLKPSGGAMRHWFNPIT